MNKLFASLSVLCALVLVACTAPKSDTTDIPLPEHPRPDFQRADWQNLNGYWKFTFNDTIAQQGLTDNSAESFDQQILVPFPWGSKLSEVEDKGDIGWYSRSVEIPKAWKGKRIFLVVGASDWETKAWIDGRELGTNQGGYTPFEFELTDNVKFGKAQQLFLRADDTASKAHLYGKQGYGNARGIWQTVYLEARGNNYIKSIHFTPDIDQSLVHVDMTLNEAAAAGSQVSLTFPNGEQDAFTADPQQTDKLSFDVALKDQHLWNLDDPYLYDVKATLSADGKAIDEVSTYFGQRKIGTAVLPGTDYKYIALNNKPIYMQLCLDQSYNPDGFYTFPSDEFIKNEILLSKRLGLTGNRVHIKVEVPRKLYWADKLGLLIMADVPNFWGEPVDEARADWEHCLREQVARDYNHPCIFAWVDFNETWGLTWGKEKYGKGVYTPETQEWVRSMYQLTKSLDASRLVEDNSACNNDHVATDINSWHSYNRGYVWDEVITKYDDNTFPGSSFNFIGDNKQTDAPMMNSECGNVWGYSGSAGDCDFTWDYHIMIDAFRRHPKCCGWLYTEHHDVINEWNGYVKYDRTPKYDGLDELVPGMTIADFQSPYYVEPQVYLFTTPQGGQTLTVPVYASFMTDKNPGALTLATQLVGWDQLGNEMEYDVTTTDLTFEPYLSKKVADVKVEIPDLKGLYVLRMTLKNEKGEPLHHNFTTFRVKTGKDGVPEKERVVTFEPRSFTAQQWSIKQAAVLDGLKENGFGNGYFEYTVNVPQDIKADQIKSLKLLFEASAKEPFGKDLDGEKIDGDYMLGHGTYDHCKSPNSYAQTDDILWPSQVNISVNGTQVASEALADDPADHRGILSWGSQPNEPHLYEAGSYGQLIQVDVPAKLVTPGKPLVIRLAVSADVHDGKGGLAIYGKDFGRYPLDPTLVFEMK